jgi:plastocyanin
MKTQWCLGVALVAFVGLSGCTTKMGGGSDNEDGLMSDVSATDNQFTPNSLNLKENQGITVKNDGNSLHSVTVHKAGDAATSTKKDADIAKGTSTDYTFDESGTFHVFCKYHSGGLTGDYSTGMVLTVTVKEG